MHRLAAALAALTASLTVAGSAAAVDFGATEDEGKLEPTLVYDAMADLGLTTNVMSVTWDPFDPTAPPDDMPAVLAALEAAKARDIGLTLAVYQGKARGLTDTPSGARLLAAWVQDVLRACDGACTKVVYLNEPNQTRFFQPVFDPACAPASPKAYTEALAVGYDAVKEVDESIRVYGVGLSPRGNDNCRAPSNVSHSPIRFLAAMGAAYRAMGRTAPLMDALSFHPYPNLNTDAPTRGYAYPNAGLPNLDRLMTAVDDAFAGTGQTTFREGLQVALDEVGWQVETADREGYTGTENVPVVDEATQAEYYADVVRLVVCEPAVESLSFFHLVDEPDRDRFQSGLLRLDGTPRPAYDAVKAAIAETGGTCAGAMKRSPWAVPATVAGVSVAFGKAHSYPASHHKWRLTLTAAEDVAYSAGILRASAAGRAARLLGRLAGAQRPVLRARGAVRAYRKRTIAFPKRRLRAGRYVFAVRIGATANPSRAKVMVSRPFVVRERLDVKLVFLIAGRASGRLVTEGAGR